MFGTKERIAQLERKIEGLEKYLLKMQKSREDVAVVTMRHIVNQVQEEKREMLDRFMSRDFADFALARQALKETEEPLSTMYSRPDADAPDEESVGEIVNAQR